MDIPYFIHPSVDGHVGCFNLLAIMNNAAMNIQVQVFVWTYVFSFLEYMPRSGIAESLSGELPNCFPKWLHHFIFPPAMYEGGYYFKSSQGDSKMQPS